MKTYTEESGKEPFDWRVALQDKIEEHALPEPGLHGFSPLSQRAMSWTTCACGNQCADIPRDMSGQPIDVCLATLGKLFFDYVEGGYWKTALKILEQIEQRSSKILSQMATAGASAAPRGTA